MINAGIVVGYVKEQVGIIVGFVGTKEESSDGALEVR